MKKHLLYLLASIGVLVAISASFVPSTQVSAAPDPSACNNLLPNCIGAQTGGASGKSVKQVCPNTLTGFPNSEEGSPFFRCQVHWAQAAGKNVPDPSIQAQSFCQQRYAGDYFEDCKKGFDGDNCGNNAICKKGEQAERQNSQSVDPNAASGGESLEGDPCNVSANPLTWIVCPVVDGLNELVKGLDSQITSLLSVGSPDNSTEPNQIFCSSTTATKDRTGCRSYKAAWSSVRNIALGFIVIVVLLIVISQALNMEILDAYTIRKAVPRVLVAAIAVTLSWELMQFAVTLSNDLGYGIRFLIYEPFVRAGIEPFSLDLSGSFLLNLIGAGAIAILGIFGVLSYAATAALAVLAAFLVLILREMLIIMLVIFAPLAIVAFVLPNTQKGYRFWYDNFMRALLMFPMIAGMIAIGRVFAAVATDNGGFIGDLIGFAAYFGPYFMIPFTYKFAGSLMSGVGGAVTQRTAGMQQGLQQFRSKQAQKRRTNAATRIQGGNALKRAPPGSARAKFNRGLQGATMLNEAGVHPGRWKTNMRTALGDASSGEAEKFEQENASFNAWNGDDAKLWAAKHHGREAISSALEYNDAERFAGAGNAARRDEAVSQIMRTQQQTSNDTFQKARLSAQQKTGTGYQNHAGEFDAAMAMQDINDTYGSDRNGAGKNIAKARNNLQQSGQMAGTASFNDWVGQLDALHEGRTTAVAAHKAVMRGAANSATAQQKLYGKPSSARAFAEVHADKIRNIALDPRATHGDLSAAVAEAAGIYDAMGSASPLNASAFAEGLMDVEIPGTGANVREWTQMQMNQDPEFVNRRKDYGDGLTSESRAAAAAAGELQPGAEQQAGGSPQTGPPQ